ncbi:MAG: Gfo/Idh/MocA family oxidoreductase [Bryobacteraceae bacterium]
MKEILRGGIIGCGFFAQHHIEGWSRVPGVELVAACDLELQRARAAAPHAYTSAQEMLDRERLDFVEIVTRVDLHLPMVQLAVERKIPVLCQKPIAPDWATAVKMVDIAEAAGVRLMIHENWRWQPWYRAVRAAIDAGRIGAPIGYGFITRCRDGLGENPYPRQAYFRGLKRFLIDEALVHHLDTARFLFGDLEAVYAQAVRRNPRIQGEDFALICVMHRSGVQGWVDGHRFLDALQDGPVLGDAFFEGEDGRLRVMPTGDVRLGGAVYWTNNVTAGYRGDSVRATQAHFIDGLRGGIPFESEGRAYLHTFAAVEACYRSTATHCQVRIDEVTATAGA